VSVRSEVKSLLAFGGSLDRCPATGATLLIHHRVGGGTSDELDLPVAALEEQLDLLVDEGHDVLALDVALDRLDAGDSSPSIVLTFDDGFRDVHASAWPLLHERQLPFTVYLTAGLVGNDMQWEGSTAASQGAAALTWEEVAEMHASGLCTVANHTWDHAGPDTVDEGQLDRCSDLIEARLGERPRHFAWTWGVEVPRLRTAIATRFRSAATGELGRNQPGCDTHALRRVPVRATDPLAFYRAKLQGRLLPERTYATLVAGAKRVARRSSHA
jgi:peptidoglycan/xylan/chitin deacetylase (PgdA/CDA1 family)